MAPRPFFHQKHFCSNSYVSVQCSFWENLHLVMFCFVRYVAKNTHTFCGLIIFYYKYTKKNK
jgi:hypothetical protein